MVGINKTNWFSNQMECISYEHWQIVKLKFIIISFSLLFQIFIFCFCFLLLFQVMNAFGFWFLSVAIRCNWKYCKLYFRMLEMIWIAKLNWIYWLRRMIKFLKYFNYSKRCICKIKQHFIQQHDHFSMILIDLHQNWLYHQL